MQKKFLPPLFIIAAFVLFPFLPVWAQSSGLSTTPASEGGTAQTTPAAATSQPQAGTSRGAAFQTISPVETTSTSSRPIGTPIPRPTPTPVPAAITPQPATSSPEYIQPQINEAPPLPVETTIETPTAPDNSGTLNALIAGIVVLGTALGTYGILRARKKKSFSLAKTANKTKKVDDRCDKIKVLLEQKKQALNLINNSISTQEQFTATLKKKIEEKIEEKKDALKEKVIETAKDAILEVANSKTLEEVVGAAEAVKETYDNLIKKSEQVKKLIETLKAQRDVLVKTVHVFENAYNVCMQGGPADETVTGSGEELELPELAGESKRVLVIGASLSGKTALIRYLRANSKLPLFEIDEELTALNNGVYPADVEYKQKVLTPQVIKKVLETDKIVFFTNTDYFSVDDIKKAREKNFKIIQLSLPLEKLKERNSHRIKHEGYEDLGRHLEGMTIYQKQLYEYGLVDEIVDADHPIDTVAKKVLSVL